MTQLVAYANLKFSRFEALAAMAMLSHGLSHPSNSSLNASLGAPSMANPFLGCLGNDHTCARAMSTRALCAWRKLHAPLGQQRAGLGLNATQTRLQRPCALWSFRSANHQVKVLMDLENRNIKCIIFGANLVINTIMQLRCIFGGCWRT